MEYKLRNTGVTEKALKRTVLHRIRSVLTWHFLITKWCPECVCRDIHWTSTAVRWCTKQPGCTWRTREEGGKKWKPWHARPWPVIPSEQDFSNWPPWLEQHSSWFSTCQPGSLRLSPPSSLSLTSTRWVWIIPLLTRLSATKLRRSTFISVWWYFFSSSTCSTFCTLIPGDMLAWFSSPHPRMASSLRRTVQTAWTDSLGGEQKYWSEK